MEIIHTNTKVVIIATIRNAKSVPSHPAQFSSCSPIQITHRPGIDANRSRCPQSEFDNLATLTSQPRYVSLFLEAERNGDHTYEH